MDPSFQTLLARLDHLAGQFKELKDGVHKAVLVADLDPEMALTRARKVLEFIIRDVYERRINEPPGTRPLENLLQRLVKDGYFPDRLDAYANTIRKLGNVGTHSFGEQVTVADVYQSLTQLMPILEWYFEVERPEPDGQKPDRTPRPTTLSEKAMVAPAATIAIVPKGLRLDAKDADFFLDLLPGPRDKDGLPESIRFWKHRVEATDEVTFTVGVIYGPSGCGKSSLVKAGLLPRLTNNVLSVYVEATAGDTEGRLLKGLRKRCPSLPGDLDLTGTIAAVRQGQGLNKSQKVFIVLDQFEQWLHARRDAENTDLVQALRQCDGEKVQCVVMVRDDFWMALTRMMKDLQIELLQGQNAAAVDLFDLIHARNVLWSFGRAFGRLHNDLTRDQEAFLDQAVQGLSQEGRVISVRLSLFAEMMKGKSWIPATLKEVGGTQGIGVTFLEETFSSTTAPPEHRYHQKAARALLQSLLPESGTVIKGHMRSQQELLEASGYGSRAKDFDDLIRILDGELRLITPTDPEDKEDTDVAACARTREASTPPSGEGGYTRYFQLTHDYLVPSIRGWLTRKQKETRRGRAELLLADRTVVWISRSENRQLPSLLQWSQISLLTQKKNWTPPQRKMMQKASRYHLVRGAALGLLLVVAIVTGLVIREQVVEQHKATEAAGLVQAILNADTAQVSPIINELAAYRQWADPLLREQYDRAVANSPQQLHASLALLPVDATQVEYLYGRLLKALPQEVPVIGDALVPYKDALLEKLWAVAEKLDPGKEAQRLRAVSALAKFDPDNERWAKVQEEVAHDLVKEPAVYLTPWMNSLRPVREKLLAPLAAVFRDSKRRETERSLATDILADYAADQPKFLADLLMDADVQQFAVLYPKCKQGLPVLTDEIEKKLPPEMPSADDHREKLAKRQANAAVALLRMNQPEKVWPLLKHSPDPRVRSYLVHRLGPLGADIKAIIKRQDEEPDITIRRALILSLGEFGEREWPAGERNRVTTKLQDIYRVAADPGLHAAAEWLLREWKRDDWLKTVNDEWAKGKVAGGAWRVEGKGKLLPPATTHHPSPGWYVNTQGQTMVVIPGPVTFLMGSPPSEKDRRDDEQQHQIQIGRTFALAAKSVTVDQYRRFDKSYTFTERYAPTSDCPAGFTSWYQAAAYCNWLSKQEGLDPCYEMDGQGQVTKLTANYLSVTGYRLPTEAEWEYACRAGATTSRYYGETEELLGNYGCVLQTAKEVSWPVGSKKPNDLGLFDMHGNVWGWCQESYTKIYGQGKGDGAVEDKEDGLVIVPTERRVMRGGAFYYLASNVRSANRDSDVPSVRVTGYGFRPARTLLLGSHPVLPPTPEGSRK